MSAASLIEDKTVSASFEMGSLFGRNLTPKERHWLSVAREVSDELYRGAAESYRRREPPFAEMKLVRDSGLSNLLLPEDRGGGGGSWMLGSEVLREIAAGNGSIGVLLTHHYFGTDTLPHLPEPRRTRLIDEFIKHRRWFGVGGVNPRDPDLLAKPIGNGRYLLNGQKTFCTGAALADYISVMVRVTDTGQFAFVLLPAIRKGIKAHKDWDAVGLPLAESGTFTYSDVEVEPDELIAGGLPKSASGKGNSDEPTLGALGVPTGHLFFSNVYLGIAIGAMRAARDYIQTTTRPWLASGVARAADDPYIVHRFGGFWAQLEAAQAVSNQAAARVEVLRATPIDRITAKLRGETAVAVATLKILATRASVDITSQLFELTGARSTAASYGLDRFWRDVRTYSLHNPYDYKVREVGDYALNGRFPRETFYT
jgi:alkylation response protein AidB-like acyl-CoA dehydrogenase